MTLPFSPSAIARIVPFAAFMLLLALRGALPEDGSAGIDPRWVYGVTVVVVGALLAWWWREYAELSSRQVLPNWRETVLAVLVGIVVFWLWTRLDEPWMRLGEPSAGFRPLDADGNIEWALVAVRAAGAALLVPVMEELFWRSFLMRWIEAAPFERVDPRTVGLKAIVLSTFVFMLAHTLWLAAIVAGLAYAWLYRYTGKLWTAVIAHAVTNAMLAGWVVLYGHWTYW